ncbi:MAG TPA: hypothetical protein VJ373_07820 [Desulfatiglandales bacterium]|nr:hypothetical protein [Desulfatiglandales bacterium]
MSKSISNKIKRWAEAPKPTQIMPDAPAVLGVILAFGEEVEWIWTHTDKGSYVSGYNIVNKQGKSI